MEMNGFHFDGRELYYNTLSTCTAGGILDHSASLLLISPSAQGMFAVEPPEEAGDAQQATFSRGCDSFHGRTTLFCFGTVSDIRLVMSETGWMLPMTG